MDEVSDVSREAQVQRRGGRDIRQRDAQRGFSLLELLIAMSITVFGLLGLVSLHRTTIQGNQVASSMVEATTIAQRTMEEIRSIPVQSPDPTIETLSTMYPVWPVTDAPMSDVTNSRGDTYLRFLSLRELAISPELVMVRIEVRWSDNGADPTAINPLLNHSIAMEMIRTRQEEL